MKLTVNSIGKDADREVEPIEIGFGEGGFGTGGAKVAAEGRPDGQIVVTAANLGDASTSAETRLTAQLPPGLVPTDVEGVAGEDAGEEGHAIGNDGPVVCSPGSSSSSSSSSSCVFKGALGAYHQIEMRIGVYVEPSAHTGGLVAASVTGGGAPEASVERPITVSGEPTPFGVSEYELAAEEEGGAPDTQAGSHPFQLTTTLNLNQVFEPTSEVSQGLTQPAQLAKDLHFKLPPGLIGNPTPFPQCTMRDYISYNAETGEDNCSPQTAVGVARITLSESHFIGLRTFVVPVFNLEPSVGEPASFGFMVAENPVVLDTSVRTGGDYGVTVSVNNIIQTAGFMKNEVTFWGVPGDPRHDAQRGWGCLLAESNAHHQQPCNPTEPHNPPPLLSMPTSCTGASLQSSVEADPWVHRGAFETVAPVEPMPALDGCNRLPFSDSIAVTPDGQAAGTPTGQEGVKKK